MFERSSRRTRPQPRRRLRAPKRSSLPATPRPLPVSTTCAAELDVPIIDVVAPGAQALVKTTDDRSGRRDRHRRHGVVRCLPPGDRGRPAHRSILTSAACPGFVEFVERGQTVGDEVTRARRATARAHRRGERRRAAARVHSLSVPRPDDQRRDGSGRDAGQLGRRDGIRRAAPARRSRPPADVRRSGASTDSCRVAMSRNSASSARHCSDPNSTDRTVAGHRLSSIQAEDLGTDVSRIRCRP